MKKKLLFVIESLTLGGAEKSLVTLLNLLDYEKYDVDLQLFAYGGEFEKLLPEEVNLLPILSFFQYCKIPYRNIGAKLGNIRYLKSQLAYSIALRSGKYNNIEKSVLMWEKVGNSFEESDTEYDVAIAYAQGVPTFFVADKIRAKKKIAWINVTYLPQGRYKSFIDRYYDKFDFINLVSESVSDQFKDTFKRHLNRQIIIKDILDFKFNKKMAQMEPENKFDLNNSIDYKLLTVGRLVNQKGYDLAVEACKILKERGNSFVWYVIGEGNQREKIEEKIQEYKLEDYFVLLGAKNNPYPYFRDCDIYVQTSKFEGFGITIAEARMFNKPVVTTEFDAVYSQMVQDKNGLVVKMNPEAIVDGIEKLMNDKDYRENIISYLETEQKSNLEELEKFYNVIN